MKSKKSILLAIKGEKGQMTDYGPAFGGDGFGGSGNFFSGSSGINLPRLSNYAKNSISDLIRSLSSISSQLGMEYAADDARSNKFGVTGTPGNYSPDDAIDIGTNLVGGPILGVAGKSFRVSRAVARIAGSTKGGWLFGRGRFGKTGIINGRLPWIGGRLRFGWGWDPKLQRQSLRFSGSWLKKMNIGEKGHFHLRRITDFFGNSK